MHRRSAKLIAAIAMLAVAACSRGADDAAGAQRLTRLPIDPAILRRGDNEIVVHSDTEHHGIEVLLPGPAIVVRYSSR